MNKFILTILSALIWSPLYSSELYDLRWKVKEGDYIAYKTTMDQIGDKDKNYLKIDLNQVFEEGHTPGRFNDQIESLKFPTNATATTVIKGMSKNKLTFEMIVENVTFPQTAKSNKLEEFLKKFNGMVQLRGEINNKGEITSWYLEQRQKNLLAILVQLPSSPVAIGDTWALDINLVSMGATFKANMAKRNNKVRLARIEVSSTGSKLAVLDYVLGETVDGFLFNPSTGKEMPITLSLGFLGRGIFDIDNGRWESFNGRMHSKSNGQMSGEGQQQMSMQLVSNVPENILNAR